MQVAKKIVFFSSAILFFVSDISSFMTKKHCYLLENAGLSRVQCDALKKAILSMREASSFDLIKAARIAASDINKIIDRNMKVYEEALPEDKEPIELALAIITFQKEHLENFARIAWHHLSLFKKIKGYYYEFFYFFKRFFTHSELPIIQLSNQIFTFLEIERTECFQSYMRVKHYFVFQKFVDIPAVVNVWDYAPIRFNLEQKIKKFSSLPKVQSSAFSIVSGTVKTAGKAIAKSATKAVGKIASAAKGLFRQGADEFIGATRVVRNQVDDIVKVNNQTVRGVTAEGDEFLKPLSESFVNTMKNSDDMVVKSIAPEVLDEKFTPFEKTTTQLLQESDQTITSLPKTQAAIRSLQKRLGINIAESTLDDVVSDIAKFAEKLEVTPVESLVSSAKEVSIKLSNVAKETGDDFVKALGGQVKVSRGKMSLISDVLKKERISVMQSGAKSSVRDGALKSIKQAHKQLKSTIKKDIKDLKKVMDSIKKTNTNYLNDTKFVASKNAVTDLTKGLDDVTYLFKQRPILVWKSRLKELLSFVGQAEIMSGSQLAISWVDEADAETYAMYREAQAEMESNFTSALAQINQAAEAQKLLIEKMGEWSISILSEQQKNLIDIFQAQQNYLSQSLVSIDLAPWYVSDPFLWDQYFYYAPMYTPGSTGSSSKGFSVTTYGLPRQVFYPSTTWAVSPIFKSSKLSDTVVWKVNNGFFDLNALNPLDKSVMSPLQSVSFPTMSVSFPTVPIAHTWYNVSRRGSWSYSAKDNSFYQNQLIPNVTKEYPQGGDWKEAGYNTIFTEYVPQTLLDSQGIPTYSIEVDIQVNEAKVPWIAGIAFNKARWISGVTDNMNQYRFVGLYCSKNPTEITLVGAESFFLAETTDSERMTPITPIEQIFADQGKIAEWKQKGSGASCVLNPLYPRANAMQDGSKKTFVLGQVYTITIFTQPTSFFVKIDIKNADGSKTPFFGPIEIQQRNPIIFNGHSIGFISSGCSSRFTLLQPKELVYSAEEIAAFNALSSSNKSSSGNNSV